LNKYPQKLIVCVPDLLTILVYSVSCLQHNMCCNGVVYTNHKVKWNYHVYCKNENSRYYVQEMSHIHTCQGSSRVTVVKVILY